MYKIFLTILILVSLPLDAGAMYFVHDSEAIAKAVASYNKLQQQYQTLLSLKSDAEGQYGFGGYLDSNNELQKRKWSPASWRSALENAAGNNPERYQQLSQLYKNNNAFMSQQQISALQGEEYATTYNKKVENNQAAVVQSSYAYADINKHLDIIHQLGQAIDTTKNTKAAIDLNTRVNTELAYIQMEELRMQIITNQQLAEQQRNNLANTNLNASFTALPKE